jgi:hypothetical protein
MVVSGKWRRLATPVDRVPLVRLQAAATAVHAVDAEQKIGQAAEIGREPSETDPADGGADLALRKQNMDGDDDGDSEAEDDLDVAMDPDDQVQ